MPIEAIAETNVAPSPEGYVYMLYSAGLIKIGFTHDPVARFDGMRSMHASPISLIWLSTGTTDREREMPHPVDRSGDGSPQTRGRPATRDRQARLRFQRCRDQAGRRPRDPRDALRAVALDHPEVSAIVGEQNSGDGLGHHQVPARAAVLFLGQQALAFIDLPNLDVALAERAIDHLATECDRVVRVRTLWRRWRLCIEQRRFLKHQETISFSKVFTVSMSFRSAKKGR